MATASEQPSVGKFDELVKGLATEDQKRAKYMLRLVDLLQNKEYLGALLSITNDRRSSPEARALAKEFGLDLVKMGRQVMVSSEQYQRYTLARAVELVAAKLYDGRESEPASPPTTPPPANAANEFSALEGMMIAEEGNLAAGKTALTKKLVAAMEKHGIRGKSFIEPVHEKVLDKYYANPDLEAYASQLLFAASRSNANEASQAFSGRLPTEYPLAEVPGCSIGDRTCIGDAMFLLMVLLKGYLLMSEFDAVLSVYSPRFAFSVVLFMDISSARAEFVCKELRGRPNEKDIPLEYFEKLRLTHYALMRALAARGAPVLYTYCDDKPMTKERIAFLDPEDTLRAIIHCPKGEAVKAIWAGTAEPVYGVTTEEDVSRELAKVRERYAAYGNPYVRRVAHVRVENAC